MIDDCDCPPQSSPRHTTDVTVGVKEEDLTDAHFEMNDDELCIPAVEREVVCCISIWTAPSSYCHTVL